MNCSKFITGQVYYIYNLSKENMAIKQNEINMQLQYQVIFTILNLCNKYEDCQLFNYLHRIYTFLADENYFRF